jgi:hypothetical protein
MTVLARLWRLITTPYEPDEQFTGFLERAVTQTTDRAEVTVAVLSAAESRSRFGGDLAKHGIQPVFLRITNRAAESVRLQFVTIDPRYFTPLEAAAANHFSIARRLSAFGAMGWLFLPLFTLVPLKLVTAWLANGRMDDVFAASGFRLGPIQPGEMAEGFVFTTLDLGTKAVHVKLSEIGEISRSLSHASAALPVDLMFTIPVPGIAADFLDHDFTGIHAAATAEPCDVPQLVARLQALPATTQNATGSRAGDPVNLVLIGDFDMLLAAFAARWDASETISLATCWKTVRAFLLGSNYRYSPVSPLHLFQRVQDMALQRTRHSINERLHLRLWQTPLTFEEKPVWVGQVSRDIGVRFTTRAWNLTTHRIDPNVDESRDYVIEDLLQAGRVAAAGYVDGVGPCPATAPKRNLTGDPYHTDGRRAVIQLSARRTA